MTAPVPTLTAWDGPTRAFKWALVAVVLDGWLSNRYGGSVPDWHRWNGYAALTLVAFRVLWGFVGGPTARFSNFVAGPARVLAYVRAKPSFLGHNPLGGWMVLALLVLVAALGATGLFSADQDRLVIDGPLARTVSDSTVDAAARWHGLVFHILEAFVAVHIVANVAYSLVRREPLIGAMVTGRKPASDYADMASSTPGSWGRAAVCFVGAAALVGAAILAGRVF